MTGLLTEFGIKFENATYQFERRGRGRYIFDDFGIIEQ